jgi:hypothetical protein
VVFYVCPRCDRGQIYCRRACAKAARVVSLREIRRRHERSPEGRRDHAARQAAYRARHKVTDQGRQEFAPSRNVCVGEMPAVATSVTPELPPRSTSDDPTEVGGALARRQPRETIVLEQPAQTLHLSHAEAHQRCSLGLCQALLAHPADQLASIDFSRGHRHKSLRHQSAQESARRVSKGTFLLGPKGTFEFGRYMRLSDNRYYVN